MNLHAFRGYDIGLYCTSVTAGPYALLQASDSSARSAPLRKSQLPQVLPDEAVVAATTGQVSHVKREPVDEAAVPGNQGLRKPVAAGVEGHKRQGVVRRSVLTHAALLWAQWVRIR